MFYKNKKHETTEIVSRFQLITNYSGGVGAIVHVTAVVHELLTHVRTKVLKARDDRPRMQGIFDWNDWILSILCFLAEPNSSLPNERLNLRFIHQVEDFVGEFYVRSPLPPALRDLTGRHKYFATVVADPNKFRLIALFSDAVGIPPNRMSYDPESITEDGEDNRAITTLKLSGNPLAPITHPLMYARSLRLLDLTSCGLGQLNPNFFLGLAGLHTLILSSNSLTVLTTEIFEPLVRLESLKLDSCNLTNFAIGVFGPLDGLRNLDLSGNPLKGDWLWVAALTGIETLDLRDCNIEMLPVNIFHNNKWLKNLLLAGNRLKSPALVFTFGANLINLEYLDASASDIKPPIPVVAFDLGKRLKTLLLSGNRGSPTEISLILRRLTSLKKISLRDLGLTEIPVGGFAGIEDLDASQNPLAQNGLSALRDYKSLRHLDISYCDIKRLPVEPFANLADLRTLVISGNPIKSIEAGLLRNLQQLETLVLDDCDIKELFGYGPKQHLSIGSLSTLVLSRNPLDISSLPRELGVIKHLDLSFCNLKYLPDEALQGFENLVSLNLAGNQLTQESLGFLRNLPVLEMLDLTSNWMTEIWPTSLQWNHYLRMLKLAGNPWVCACYVADMETWVRSVKGDPDILEGLSACTIQDIAEGGRRAWRRQRLLTCADPNKNSITWTKYSKMSLCQREPPTTPSNHRGLLTFPRGSAAEHSNCFGPI
ncbi:hypothetical protein AAG570_003597 [Ranatra chinensis]|uniref:Uncharacterized protein n=1 Tax=Ranatra chinensis TaxID=642074 RepID=A0ABD0Y4H1_9HEMI